MSSSPAQSTPLELPHGSCLWVGERQSEPWHPRVVEVSCADEAVRQASDGSLIILSLPAEEQDVALWLLRESGSTALNQILVCHESALSPYLADGIFDAGFRSRQSQFQERRAQMRLSHGKDPELKLLCWMWLSEGALRPHRIPARPELYDYPLLSAWGVEPAREAIALLQNLKQKGWIEPDKLWDRTRHCPQCDSGHLNYIDVCPKCTSLDIEHRSSLHCFNCGHVGAKDQFLRQGQLACPNCSTQLRHIGVDYDRPIENQGCNSCDHLFVEARVEAHCLHCASASVLDRLKVRNIHGFRLSAAGRTLVRQGALQDLFSLVPGERMSQGQFHWLVSWQNQLALRHGHTHSVLAIEMLNLEQFLQSEGETRGFARLDALLERLKGLIRVTDACSNYTDLGLLLFLPYTSVADVRVVVAKLREMEGLQEGASINLRLRAISLPAKEMGEDVANWLGPALAGAEQL
ncbi:hypothetical protein KJI95_05400 [Shewanella sp. JM162201]|uniref:Thaumarchaeal output domain-containing protein n=1 Tax=Shewanella jiangmenensis TaxID=2837387 RepID=A0ABS5V215_9GAMM|nr:hypothetical protein [Shewanella jiangmenensis]MBT1443960.1 hypothetical protein [Shewanella jiangmenensis]